MNDFTAKLESASSMLPKQQRILCDYIRGHMLESSMLSVAQLAKCTGVAPATVIRTVQSLGYPNYYAFKTDLQKAALIGAGQSYSSFMGLQKNLIGQNDVPAQTFADTFAAYESEFHHLNNPEFTEKMMQALDLLLAAEHIYILGSRSGHHTALAFESLLFDSSIPVVQLGLRPDYVYDKLFDMSEKDVLFAIASHPVSQKTANAVRICFDRSIPTIVLTNTASAPICKYASLTLSTESISSLTYSALSVAVAEMLAREIARRSSFNPDRMQEIDRSLKKYNISLWDI